MRSLPILLLLVNMCRPASSRSDLLTDVTRFSLPNGLQVVVAVRPSLQLASVNLTVDVGSLDDPPGESGIAHMLEHTTLSGAADVGSLDPKAEAAALSELDRANSALAREKGKADSDPAVLLDLERWFAQAQRNAQATAEDREVIGSRLEARGAIGLNATTSADITQFFTSIPTADVDYWLSLEAARLKHPIFRRYYLERNVVLREIDGLTAGRATTQELLLREMFPGSPVAQSLVGDPKELCKIDRPSALAYFHRVYRPERTVIAIVGNVQASAIRAACERYFGDWRPQTAPEAGRSNFVRAPLSPAPYVRWFNSSRNPQVLMAFPHTGTGEAQSAAEDVLAEMISSEDLSPLRTVLVDSQSLAWNVQASANYPSQKRPLLFLIHLYAVSGVPHQQLLDAAQEQLRAISTLPEEDIKGGIFSAEMKLASQLDDAPNLAALLAANQAVQGDWRTSFERLETLRNLPVENVRAAARRMFGSRAAQGEASSEESGGGDARR